MLALLYMAIYARMTRNNLLETLGEDYIRTARAKGLSERDVIFKHGLRASLTPIVTLFGLDVALLVGGAIITESRLQLQGLGWLAINGVRNQELPTVLGVVLLTAAAVAIMNLVVDIVYAFFDPRVRYCVTRGSLGEPSGFPGSQVVFSGVRSRHMSSETPLLDVRDLTVRFNTRDGVVQAVSDLSFTLHRGETLGVVGESGSGKSVSSLAIMGLLNPAYTDMSGEVRFEGKNLLGLKNDELRKVRGRDISMIFQDPFACLHPMYRVGRPDRRGRPRPREGVEQAGERARRRAARRRSASPMRAAAPATSRISSRAACGSAR